MILKAVLSNPDRPEIGVVTVPFPIPRDEYDRTIELLAGLEIGNALTRDCKVEELDGSYPVLKRLEQGSVNVDELDYLAKRLDSFTAGVEDIQFLAMADKLGLSDVKDFINLTFCCQQVTVIRDFSNLEKVGKDHLAHLNGGMSTDEYMKADGKSIALALIRCGEGQITPYGVVYDNENYSDARFIGQFSKALPLTSEELERSTAEFLNGRKIVGVYDIDLDKGRFSYLNTQSGWRNYRVKDISTAAYYAYKDSFANEKRRENRFKDKLSGKELPNYNSYVFIRGNSPLPVDQLHFSGEVVNAEGNLGYYIDSDFDVDAVFGICLCAEECDDSVNIYADFDLEKGCVRDRLEVVLIRANGSEVPCIYRLTPEEQSALQPMMDSYCQEQMGMTLEAARSQCLKEQASGMQMGGME